MVNHSYKRIPQWPQLRCRYRAFWDKTVVDDRIIAHIQNPNPHPPEPEDWMLEASEDKYIDPEKLYRFMAWRCTSWNWHADLFQYKLASYGPNVFAGFCGGRPVFGADTVWHEPVIDSLDESDKIHFDPENRYWKIHVETVAWFSKRLAGDEQLGMTDLGGPADWIASLMGAENFLIATATEPDRMRDFALRLATECNRAYDLLYPKITACNDGIVNWMPVWSDRPMGTIQDDMSMNFSPEMYQNVFFPALKAMAAHTEHTVLHWHDGCSHHVERLMAHIPEIDVVQFGHDPNTGPFRDYLGVMRKIQAAGKRLFISCVEAQDASFFIDHLDPRGLLMIINTTNDDESRRMEDAVRAATQKRLAKQ